MRDPRIPSTTKPFGHSALRDIGWLFVLNVLFAFGLLGIYLIISALGVEPPDTKINFNSPLKIALAVLFAPPLEEFVFRGWLTGSWAAILFSTSIVLLFLFLAVARLLLHGLDGPAFAVILFIWAFWTGVELFISWKDRSWVPAAYRRAFPAAFWLSCLAFALAHIFNFVGEMRPLLLLLVMPQFVAGTILAFARLRYGMWANIGMHSLNNAAVALIVAMFGI